VSLFERVGELEKSGKGRKDSGGGWGVPTRGRGKRTKSS
jgi:hypothetical protein